MSTHLKLRLPGALAGGYVTAVAALLTFVEAYKGPGEVVYVLVLVSLTLPWSALNVIGSHVISEAATMIIFGLAAAVNGFLLYGITRALAGRSDATP